MSQNFPLIPIPRVSAEHLDKTIETRGLVRWYQNNHLLLQEKSKSLDSLGGIPMSIHVAYDGEITPGFYIKVIGEVKIKKSRGTATSQLMIQAADLSIISEDEADLSRNLMTETFFTTGSLEDVKADTAKDLIAKLKAHANEEGFDLVQAGSANGPKVKLRCYLHSKKGKNPELNTDCEFFINIRKGYDDDHKLVWRVTCSYLFHNHSKDPFVFIHKLINQDVKNLIFILMRNGVDNQKIARILQDNYHKHISSAQIAQICKAEKKIKRMQRIAETEELRLYMEATNGCYLYDESHDTPGIIKRKVVATFNQEEMENLRLFGDFVSIDPTYCLMTSNWSIIPLTVIGSEREIRSAGLIFASSTKSEIFRWILSILVSQLPSKCKIKTICSDDDLGLAGAFTETRLIEEKTETDNMILNLKRVICYWHKIENFVKYIASLKLPEDEQKKYISQFRLMGMTRDKRVAQQCRDELRDYEQIDQYLIENVDNKLDVMAKSRIDYFTCGYNTSSISESTNNRLKRSLPERPQSLKEIREHLTFTEFNSHYSKRFIKGRKLKKVRSSNIVEIMSKFKVAQSIAESISGSITKASRLEIQITGNQNAIVIEKKKDNTCNIDYSEMYVITNGKCSCLKNESTGLPCSHMLRFLIETKQDIFKSITIDPRWIIDQPINYEYTPNIFGKITYDDAVILPSDDKERYVLLRSKANSLVALASKSNEMYEIFNSILEEAEKALAELSTEPTIIDEFSKRPGRKNKSTAQKESNSLICGICDGQHSTARCPHKKEMIKFAPQGSSKEGKYHCSLCDFSGHNASTCPAKKAWLESLKNE